MDSTKNAGKAKTPKRKNAAPGNEKKKLSPIAKYWETVDRNDWEIVDMQAVLK
jgi:hypothetical protein